MFTVSPTRAYIRDILGHWLKLFPQVHLYLNVFLYSVWQYLQCLHLFPVDSFLKVLMTRDIWHIHDVRSQEIRKHNS